MSDKKAPRNDAENMRLSDRYCSEHRSKFRDGTWNPLYKSAKRAASRFDTELKRLQKQNAQRDKRRADSGNPVVDSYVYNLVAQDFPQYAEKETLRDKAREMVDNRLTDRKKAIIAMLISGLNQSQIAKTLGISRQAVSKACASIPKALLLADG